jgi:hypothetical protein
MNQQTDTAWARMVLIAVKKRGLYAHHVIQASHERGIFAKTGDLAGWRARLIEAAVADGLTLAEVPKQ